MTRFVLHHKPTELYHFLVERVRQSPERILILVRSQATKRFLTRNLQKEAGFFSPKIETLESWLDELAALSFDDSNHPLLILSPDERVLVLEDWLRNNSNEAYQKFAGAQSVQAISNIIADLRRANLPLDQLSEAIDEEKFFGTPHFASLLKDYQTFLQKKNWVDREQLPSLLKVPDSTLIPQDELILFEPNYLFAGQKKGMEVVLDFFGNHKDKKVTLIQFIPKTPDQEDLTVELVRWLEEKSPATEFIFSDIGKSKESYSLLDNYPANQPLYTQVWHDERTELDQALRQIAHQLDKTKTGQHGSRCEDYVILAGDISRYESMAEPLARRYGLPVYCSRGPSLNSHPVVRRLLKLLCLIPEGFQIDDVYQIFADNQIQIPRFEHDSNSTPNIRSFSQFCRHYNLRTLTEVSEQLDSIFDAQKSHATSRAQTDKDVDIDKSMEKLKANHLFYQEIINKLLAFQEQYTVEGIHPLTNWISHATSLLSFSENLYSSEANVIRSRMLETLAEIREKHERLGLSPELSHDEFIDILKLTLQKHQEKPDEQPEGIMLTQAGYFSDTFGKTVFILGMNENGFPAGENLDYLQFRYEDSLSGMLYQARPDRYLEARLELSRQLAGAERLFISRPEHLSQKKAIGSSLWQDLLLEMEKQDIGNFRWPDDPGKTILCQGDKDKQLTQNVSDNVYALFQNNQPTHSELIAAITQERENTDLMGCYDGMLDGSAIHDWKPALSKQRETWWKRNVPDDLIHTSITKLDEYALSPLDYFFKRVLRLTPPERYRDEAESDIKGSLLHEILQAFYTAPTPFAVRYKELVWPGDDMEAAGRRMKEITQSVLDAYGNQLGYKESPFPAILVNNINRITNWFLQYELLLHEKLSDDVPSMRPATLHKHENFGMEYHWTLSRNYGDIKAKISGKIDRIDVDMETGSAVVYDYKSGTSAIRNFHQHINFGKSFQLPVYAMAVFDQGIRQFAGGYYSLPLSKSKKDVCVHYVIGDEKLFDPSFFYRKRSSVKGITREQKFHRMLKKIEQERLLWIFRNLKKGTFNISLSGKPNYSDFKWISRYNEKIQKDRRNTEELLRLESEQPHQLFRYYAPLEVMADS